MQYCRERSVRLQRFPRECEAPAEISSGVRGSCRAVLRPVDQEIHSMTHPIARLLGIATIFSLFVASPSRASEPSPIAIGSRRELLVDDYLIASRHGVEL